MLSPLVLLLRGQRRGLPHLEALAHLKLLGAFSSASCWRVGAAADGSPCCCHALSSASGSAAFALPGCAAATCSSAANTASRRSCSAGQGASSSLPLSPPSHRRGSSAKGKQKIMAKTTHPVQQSSYGVMQCLR